MGELCLRNVKKKDDHKTVKILSGLNGPTDK